jgi:hypothetical protein
MRSERAVSDREPMLGRTSRLLLCQPLLVANDEKPGDTSGEGVNPFGGSRLAVSPAGARLAPRSQPQGGGGYDSGY